MQVTELIQDVAPYGGGGVLGIAVITYMREAMKKLTSIDKQLAVFTNKHENLEERVDRLEKKIELTGIPDRIGG